MRIRVCFVLIALLWGCVQNGVAAGVRRVNAPYFETTVLYPEAAVFWFGQISDQQNYTDVRVGYSSQELWVNVAIVDRYLWQDGAATRTPDSLELWDAATITLDTAASPGALPATSSYRFTGELRWYGSQSDYQACYRGNGSGWSLAALPFTAETGWRGNAPNDSSEDRGWTVTFHIPFSSLGLSGRPTSGTVWHLGVLVHDRDAQGTPAVSNKFWPEAFKKDQPNTWGELGFGLRPGQSATIPASAQTYTLRNKLNGVVVKDAMVGGSSVCGNGLDFFTQWGSANYTHSTLLVTQNQGDIADWPCFSKIFISFPLDSLPAGKVVVSAALTIYQFGNSDPSQAQSSLVQVLTVGEDWNEDTITWNNAPLAQENVGQSWVDPLTTMPPWPGAARTWDVTWAAAQAYAGKLAALRLALYEADWEYHSGKYYSSSDSEDWNATGRPVLVIKLADTTLSPPKNLRIVP